MNARRNAQWYGEDALTAVHKTVHDTNGIAIQEQGKVARGLIVTGV
jgi:hypothetical protein